MIHHFPFPLLVVSDMKCSGAWMFFVCIILLLGDNMTYVLSDGLSMCVFRL